MRTLHIRGMPASMVKRRQMPGSERTLRTRRHAWHATAGAVIVTLLTLAMASSLGHVSGALQSGTPGANPGASPEASPVASAVVEAGFPSTQIIVGEITIEITASGFRPTYFESAVGRDITMTVVNKDSQPHNLTIEKLNVDVDIQPGESETIEIEQPQLGRYEFFSDLPGDEDMRGAFSVFI